MQRPFKFSEIFSVLREAFREWNADEPFSKSAAAAYYAVFSLPGLLLIIVAVAGVFLDESQITGAITGQLAEILGKESADNIVGNLLENKRENKSTIGTVIGLGTLIFGATGLFFELQRSLNAIWRVEKKEDAGILIMIKDRATSLGIVIVVGFLLLLSLIISATVSAVSDWMTRNFSEDLVILTHAANIVLSLIIITLLFATIFKVLPDVEIPWRMVWLGAFITCILFTLGKTIIAFYLSKTEPGSSFGASGAIILFLLWVSYSCLILFFGAKFTQVFGRRYGYRLKPSSHAKYTAEYILAHKHETEADRTD